MGKFDFYVIVFWIISVEIRMHTHEKALGVVSKCLNLLREKISR